MPPDGGTESLDEQARRKGVRAIRSADDLAQDGVFDTDEELRAGASALQHRPPGLGRRRGTITLASCLILSRTGPCGAFALPPVGPVPLPLLTSHLSK